jgi:uncharacterized membrane protein YbhN (UPF0104 family)
MQSVRVRQLLRVASALLVVGLLALLIHKVDWTQVGLALEHAKLGYIALAVILNFVNLACKTARWRTLLLPIRPVRFSRLFHYLIMSYAASALVPARAGEALRVFLLRKRDGVPAVDSVGVIVVEKLFELIGLLLVVSPIPLLLMVPRWVARSTIGLTAGGLLGVALIMLIGARQAPEGVALRWQGLRRGAAFLRNPQRVAESIGWSVAAYLIDALEIWFVLRALSIDVPWATPALVLLGANLAIIIPSTPGQFGALEAGVVAVLAIVHVPTAPALAFALVYHVSQLLPIVLVGLSGVRMMGEVRGVPSPPEPAEVAAS